MKKFTIKYFFLILVVVTEIIILIAAPYMGLAFLFVIAIGGLGASIAWLKRDEIDMSEY